MSRLLLAAALVVLALSLVACGEATPVSVDAGASDPTPGEDVPDTMPRDDDVEQSRAEAQALVGTPEDELAPSVRVSRRGDEDMMLTMDYVIGRMTVELDDDGTGVYTVTSVIVELPDGPETFR